MHRIIPEPRRGVQHGLTLIEMVVAMVVVAIVVAAMIFFVYPVRQAVDVVVRAELTDMADNALQRISREVRLALPNSVRVAGGGTVLELIPVRTAGRYRAESTGAVCDTGTDELAFDTADTCFKTIGTISAAGSVTSSDFLVLNNYGENFTGQNAYATSGTAADPLNRRPISSVTSEAGRERVEFGPGASPGGPLKRALHDSPGRRFYIVGSPVSYACAAGNLTRYTGYGFAAAQPTAFAGGALLASNVTGCVFDYQPNAVGPQVGLLTLRLTLTKAISGGGTESISLYQAVHVSNLP